LSISNEEVEMNRTQLVSQPRVAAARMLSVAEVAQIIGVSRKLIQQWIESGLLPAFQLGPQTRVIRVREGDLETFIQRHIRADQSVLMDQPGADGVSS
jgi:excisionase family DNA binding protein